MMTLVCCSLMYFYTDFKKINTVINTYLSYISLSTHPEGRLLHSKFLSAVFKQKSEDHTFGFYNLAHSDVTVFHTFKPKVEKIFMNSNE